MGDNWPSRKGQITIVGQQSVSDKETHNMTKYRRTYNGKSQAHTKSSEAVHCSNCKYILRKNSRSLSNMQLNFVHFLWNNLSFVLFCPQTFFVKLIYRRGKYNLKVKSYQRNIVLLVLSGPIWPFCKGLRLYPCRICTRFTAQIINKKCDLKYECVTGSLFFNLFISKIL